MSGLYLTDLADWLRAAGIRDVREWSGWQTRARSSGGYTGGRPWCVMWHHTASSADWDDDAAYCATGSGDAPICNLIVNRDGSVTVIAAGATNTNGKGRPLTFSKGTVPQDQMNTHAVGMEIANNGQGEPFPQAQIDSAFAASLVICGALMLQPDDVAGHWDYAPDRKIDPATAAAVQGPWRPDDVTSSGTWSLDDLRSECLTRAYVPPPPEDDDMEVIELRVGGTDATFLALLSKAGGKDAILWAEWVNGFDGNQVARLNAYRSMGTRVYELASTANLSGVGLIGPIPTGDSKHNWSRSDFGNVLL